MKDSACIHFWRDVQSLKQFDRCCSVPPVPVSMDDHADDDGHGLLRRCPRLINIDKVHWLPRFAKLDDWRATNSNAIANDETP